MGQSTDANLAYGIDIGEEWIIPKEWNGLTDADDDYWGIELEDFINETTDDNNPEVELEIHCSYECPMYIIAVPGTNICASRGYPQDIDHERLEYAASDGAIERYSRWCEKHLPEKFKIQDPRWILYSMWG